MDEDIPIEQTKHNRYNIELVNASAAILPGNLYAHDMVYLNRNFAAIRLFKEKAIDEKEGKHQKK